MRTDAVIRHLLAHDPSLHSPFHALGMIATTRMQSGSERTEWKHMLEPFTSHKLHMLAVLGMVESILIIPRPDDTERRRRVHDILWVNGWETSMESWSRGKMVSEMNRVLNLKDYFPESSYRRVIWVDSYTMDRTRGCFFSECGKNMWMLNRFPFSFDMSGSAKVGSKEILNQLVSYAYDKE